jgi:hypothetical protein
MDSELCCVYFHSTSCVSKNVAETSLKLPSCCTEGKSVLKFKVAYVRQFISQTDILFMFVEFVD